VKKIKDEFNADVIATPHKFLASSGWFDIEIKFNSPSSSAAVSTSEAGAHQADVQNEVAKEPGPIGVNCSTQCDPDWRHHENMILQYEWEEAEGLLR
jgi:hypothetical protein